MYQHVMDGFLIDWLDSQGLVLLGMAGLLCGGMLIWVFIYRRLRWRLRRFVKTASAPRGIIIGLRNTIAVLLLIATSGMFLFIGLFLQTYYRFTYEIPVAEISTWPLGNTASMALTQVRYHPVGRSSRDRYFFVYGDQWMIEGDILKWKPWLNLLGLHTRYRLTRLQGRYIDINAERSAPRSLFSLIDHSRTDSERHPFWQFLYRSGQKLPLVDTVYGNAAYQNLHDERHYHVFVGTSGLIIRELKKGGNRAAKSRT